MSKQPSFALSWVLILFVMVASSCSKTSEEAVGEGSAPQGDDSAVSTIRAAARALARPDPTLDYVAAQMEGLIKTKTKTQAFIEYDGYRATLTTPAGRVTRISFELTEAKPSVEQLKDEFGDFQEHPRGALFRFESAATEGKIDILAEPVSPPADLASLVDRVSLQGALAR